MHPKIGLKAPVYKSTITPTQTTPAWALDLFYMELSVYSGVFRRNAI